MGKEKEVMREKKNSRGRWDEEGNGKEIEIEGKHKSVERENSGREEGGGEGDKGKLAERRWAAEERG